MRVEFTQCNSNDCKFLLHKKKKKSTIIVIVVITIIWVDFCWLDMKLVMQDHALFRLIQFFCSMWSSLGRLRILEFYTWLTGIWGRYSVFRKYFNKIWNWQNIFFSWFVIFVTLLLFTSLFGSKIKILDKTTIWFFLTKNNYLFDWW